MRSSGSPWTQITCVVMGSKRECLLPRDMMTEMKSGLLIQVKSNKEERRSRDYIYIYIDWNGDTQEFFELHEPQKVRLSPTHHILSNRNLPLNGMTRNNPLRTVPLSQGYYEAATQYKGTSSA